jgi:hypothetical protein
LWKLENYSIASSLIARWRYICLGNYGKDGASHNDARCTKRGIVLLTTKYGGYKQTHVVGKK